MGTIRRLGQGWGFPLAVDPVAGRLPFASGPDKVAQSIQIILDTEPGERVMRPDFGCGLRRYLMKPNTVATWALIQHDVQTALSRWEPRISLTGVEVVPGDDPALVLIHIRYLHTRDQKPANLVYPFYLE